MTGRTPAKLDRQRSLVIERRFPRAFCIVQATLATSYRWLMRKCWTVARFRGEGYYRSLIPHSFPLSTLLTKCGRIRVASYARHVRITLRGWVCDFCEILEWRGQVERDTNLMYLEHKVWRLSCFGRNLIKMCKNICGRSIDLWIYLKNLFI